MSKELRSEAEIMQKRLYIFITSSHESVHKLYYIADELDMNFKKISIAKIAGSSVSIVGGILAVIGFGLSFVTFGASLGLSIAGQYKNIIHIHVCSNWFILRSNIYLLI